MMPALQKLGFTTYGLSDVVKRGKARAEVPEWIAILNGRKDINADVVANFDAIIGPPGALVFDRILAASPAFTKVILMEEPDRERWAADHCASLEKLQAVTKRSASKSTVGKQLDTLLSSLFVRPSDSEESPADALLKFEEQVKLRVPSKRLLVWKYGDGWEPLCKFLEKAVPEDPFPTYDSGDYVLVTVRDRLLMAEKIVRYMAVFMLFWLAILYFPYVSAAMRNSKELKEDYNNAFAIRSIDDAKTSLTEQQKSLGTVAEREMQRARSWDPTWQKKGVPSA